MGLREDSLRFAQFITYTEDYNITDIEGLWDNATYSAGEFSVTWAVITGNNNMWSSKKVCCINCDSQKMEVIFRQVTRVVCWKK